MNNLCWCGHPKERHRAESQERFVPFGGTEEYETVVVSISCTHCPCKEYAEKPKPCDHGNGLCNPNNFPCNQFTQEPKALEEIACLCGHGLKAHINAGCNGTMKDPCPCKLFVEAKPQEALEEKECCHERWVSGECSPYCKNNPFTHGVWPAKPQEEPKKCCDCPSKERPNQVFRSSGTPGMKDGGYFTCDCPCHQKETEPKEETDADWEERQARELAECSNVMPKNMADHQRNVYNAVRDAIYLCRKRFIKSQE